MEVFHVDTDLVDIMAYSTTTSNTSNRPASSSNGTSPFRPREEWLKISPEKKVEILAKRREERGYQNGNSTNFSTTRSVNIHDIQDTVNVDDIIEYAVKPT